MRTRLLTLSCTVLAASMLLGGAYQFASAQERASQQQVEKPAFAKEKKQKMKKGERRGKNDKADIDGSYYRGPLEIALPACCDESCGGEQLLNVFYAGNPDNFVTSDGTEATSPSPALQTHMDQYNNGAFPNRQFDDPASNRVFGHTFSDLPADITCATLEIGLKARPDLPSNDQLHLNFNQNGSPTFAWGISIKDLPEANGTWENGQTAVTRLDLADLPPSGSGKTIISSINAGNLLDVYIQDDTAVDYIILTVVTYAGAWTSWLDRDNPSGKGDYETVSDFIKEGVLPQEPDPICIQCRTLDGVDWQDAGQVYHCDLPRGGRCMNAENSEQCLDYEVRFLYPD
ncbi:MAG: hypothetical protein IIB64_07190 [Proteobacteria bacterium]|nr:hypothetical protein [Pseudomonadota bacterium]